MKNTHKFTPLNNNALLRLTIISSIVFFILFTSLFIHDQYPQRIINRVFNTQDTKVSYYNFNDEEISSWSRCIEQLRYDADVVMLGDSLTSRFDFQKSFPNIKICNLGLGSDTILGITNRVEMVKSVNPEKVFLMCGINSLEDSNIYECTEQYSELVKSIKAIPSSPELFIISVLPISSEIEQYRCSNTTIDAFNKCISEIAKSENCTFININPKYKGTDGCLNGSYTEDGVHLLNSSYSIWIDSISNFL